MKDFFRRLGKAAAVILGIVVLLFAAVIIYVSVTEYKPADTEKAAVEGAAADSSAIRRGEDLKIISWNIGYGALGDNADFFMDGGKHVYTASRARLQENLDGIMAYLTGAEPDLLFLQEIDVNSMRSYGTDETALLAEAFPGYERSFAHNFNVRFVPYPVPPIGRVESGIMTLSAFPVAGAERIQLPVPFSWPVRAANLKRCLLVSRIPVEGTDRELVLCNLHLEAYDSGEGKKAQTEQLCTFLQQELDKGSYVIAGGDFNQIFSNIEDPFEDYEGMWIPGLIDVETLPGHLITLMDTVFPSCRSLDQAYAGADHGSFQYYIIDGFIVSDNIEVKQFGTQDLNFVNSDHNPVVMEFSLK